MSTPYHGYLKNLPWPCPGSSITFLSAVDGSHIKFFSIATLGQIAQ